MRLGLRFRFGPLFASIPLNGRSRRSATGGNGGTGCLTWIITVAVLAVVWPYLAARVFGQSLGWPNRLSRLVGVGWTVVWVAVALVVKALT